jgi:signal peptidase II
MFFIKDWFQKSWLIIAIAAIVIVLDQWTKLLVRANIPKFHSIAPFEALSDYVIFEHVDNYGAAFGILQNMGSFFIIVAAVVCTAILVYSRYLPSSQRLVRILLGLQMGGALGNVIDRIHQGYVTDFIKTGIPGFYYIPNYNIADSAIVLGVIGLGIYIFFEDPQRNGATESGTPQDKQTSSSSVNPAREG